VVDLPEDLERIPQQEQAHVPAADGWLQAVLDPPEPVLQGLLQPAHGATAPHPRDLLVRGARDAGAEGVLGIVVHQHVPLREDAAHDRRIVVPASQAERAECLNADVVGVRLGQVLAQPISRGLQFRSVDRAPELKQTPYLVAGLHDRVVRVGGAEVAVELLLGQDPVDLSVEDGLIAGERILEDQRSKPDGVEVGTCRQPLGRVVPEAEVEGHRSQLPLG